MTEPVVTSGSSAVRQLRQQYPRQALNWRQRPGILVLIYLGLTYALFLFGPFHWPDVEYLPLTFYVLAAFGVLYYAYRLGVAGTPRGRPLAGARLIIVSGASLATLLLFIAAPIYTTRMPWDVLESLADQRDAYQTLQEQLIVTAGQRAPIALARAFANPLVVAVLPLGIVHWSRLGWPSRIAVLVTALSSVCFSILRGTTRELADLVILTASALLISVARQAAVGGAASWLPGRAWIRRLIIAAAAIGVFTAVTERAQLRSEGATIACIGESSACAVLGDSVFGGLGDTLGFGFAQVTSYLAQGYYGLSLALGKDFESTWGVGHSAALLGLVDDIGEWRPLTPRTFVYRSQEDGWDPRYNWSTMLTWLANDVGFVGALVLMVPLGWAWGRSWIDAVVGDDRAVVVFCLLMQALFYLPANNQLTQTFDAYIAFLVWVGVWLRPRLFGSIGRART